MSTEIKPAPIPSDWEPTTNKPILAALGKALEESGEFSAILARCIIQGWDGVERITQKVNHAALSDEATDVQVMLDILESYGFIARNPERYARKFEHKRAWIERLLQEAGANREREVYDFCRSANR